MYHFMSGYTARLQEQRSELQSQQQPFLLALELLFYLYIPRKATLLGEKLKESDTTVWLVNTGWSGVATVLEVE